MRHKLPNGKRKNKYIRVRVTEEQMMELDEACNELQLERSELVRIAVLAHLKRNGIQIWK